MHPLRISALMKAGLVGRDDCTGAVGPHKSKNRVQMRRRSQVSRAGCTHARDVPLAKNPSTGTAQQRLFLVLKVVLHAVVVISEVLRLSTKSRCSRCYRHISNTRTEQWTIQVKKQDTRMAIAPIWRSQMFITSVTSVRSNVRG